MINTTCCFIGHRTINETEELKAGLIKTIEKLITENKVDTFLFGSKSRFNDLCLELVTDLKEKYPHVKRIYVRAEFPVIDEDYKNYLLKFYDDTYCPEKFLNAGKGIYVERNCEMIDKSKFCVFYYNEAYVPKNRKSGTKTSLDYAIKHNKVIIMIVVSRNAQKRSDKPL